MADLVTAAAYARLRGVSKTAVAKALASGRIDAIQRDGRRLIDVERANADWAARTDPTQQERGAPQQFARTQQALPAGAAAPPVRDRGAARMKTAPTLSLLDEKTRSERLRVRKQEIELEEMEGRSVSRHAVVAALSTKLLSAGETLQGIPDRLAAVFAAETDAAVIHRKLSDEIRAAMSAIATVPDHLK